MEAQAIFKSMMFTTSINDGHTTFISILWMSTWSCWEVTEPSQRHMTSEGLTGLHTRLISEPVFAKRGCTSHSALGTADGGRGEIVNQWCPPSRRPLHSLQGPPDLGRRSGCCTEHIRGARVVVKGSNDSQGKQKGRGLGKTSGSTEQDLQTSVTMHLFFLKKEKVLRTYHHIYLCTPVISKL